MNICVLTHKYELDIIAFLVYMTDSTEFCTEMTRYT